VPMSDFKVTDHFLVPEHVLLTDAEVKEILDRFKIATDQLPKIGINDPCVRAIAAQGKEIKPGMVVKIIRKSETAGKAVAFRVITD
jgi:DNA-directed RNA polymerase subunit H